MAGLKISLKAAVAAISVVFVFSSIAGAQTLEGWTVKSYEGKTRIEFKPWWGATVRPPDGKRWMLELVFTDDFDGPAMVMAYNGPWGYKPLAYIGGLNDGKEKTALVPISWDFIAYHAGDPTKTSLQIKRCNGDKGKMATVKQGKFREATDADRDPYFQSIRDSIAESHRREIGGKKSELSYCTFTAGAPTFKKNKDKKIVAFSWPAMLPLMADMSPVDSQIGEILKIRMTKNELQPISFGAYANGETLSEVEYSIDGLVDASGAKLDCTLHPRTAEYCVTQSRESKKGDLKRQWFPQRLWPAFKTQIPNGRSQWFILDVETDKTKSKPGTYKGKITIKSNKGSAELPVEVEVLPVSLLTMDEAGLTMGGFTQGFVSEQDMQFQISWNQNAGNLWYMGGQIPWTNPGDNFQLDFTHFSDWMVRAKKSGVKNVVHFLGGNPFTYPETWHLAWNLGQMCGYPDRKDFAKSQGKNETLDPKVRKLWVNWVKQMSAESKKSGWPEWIPTPFDEPAKWVRNGVKEGVGTVGAGGWIKGVFIDTCKAIKEADPSIRIYGSIHHNHKKDKNEGMCFLPFIDVYCTNAVGRDDEEDISPATDVPKAGKTFWQYDGCQAYDPPSQSRYNYGFYFASWGSTGMFCWAYNWFDENWIDTTKVWDNGSCGYAWETPFGTIPAPFFLGIREGCDDRRVVATVQKKVPGAAATVKSTLEEAKGSIDKKNQQKTDTVHDFNSRIDDMTKIDKWRDKLLDALSKGAPEK